MDEEGEDRPEGRREGGRGRRENARLPVAGIKNRCQTHASLEGPHHDLVYLIVDNLPGAFVVNGEDSLVHLVGFVPVLVPHRPAVTGVMEEEAVCVRRRGSREGETKGV